ncbi:MAG: 5'-methylthioadenosine/adenosylhomocysteine nucleosidase [Pigmentiphaga sp.]
MSTHQSATPLYAPIAILAAMPGELQAVLDAMGPETRHESLGLRQFHIGSLEGYPCVACLSRIGKVAAAATTVALIQRFEVGAVVFSGLAGGIHPEVNVGDVVVARQLIQHDLDARPLFPAFEAPLLGISHFSADASLSDRLYASATGFISQDARRRVVETSQGRISLKQPRVHRGLIATGDRFVHGSQAAAELRHRLPDALCVEMEGAAVAQVCHEFGVPFAVVRTISDHADQTAGIDFTDFLGVAAGIYASAILRQFMNTLAHEAAER